MLPIVTFRTTFFGLSSRGSAMKMPAKVVVRICSGCRRRLMGLLRNCRRRPCLKRTTSQIWQSLSPYRRSTTPWSLDEFEKKFSAMIYDDTVPATVSLVVGSFKWQLAEFGFELSLWLLKSARC